MFREALQTATVVAAVVALVAAGAPAPTAASPQPSPLCGVCGDSFAGGAQEYVEGATVTHSTATVTVREDGTATWRVRNRFRNASTAAHFRDNPDELRALVRDRLDDGTVDGPFELRSAAVDGQAVVLTVVDRVAATRSPAGPLVVEYLHTHGRETWPKLNVDRLTLVGPEETTVANDPADADVGGRRATWTGDGTAELYEAPNAPTSSYVVFAASGPLIDAKAAAAVALATLPTLASGLVRYHLLGAALFAAGLFGALRGAEALRRRVAPEPAELGGALVALGLLVAVASVEAVPVDADFAVVQTGAAVAVATGLVAVVRGEEATLWDVVVAGAVAAGLTVVGLTVANPTEYRTTTEIVRHRLAEVTMALPVVLAPALAAVPRGAVRGRLLAGGLVVAGFVVGAVAFVSPLESYWGLVTALVAVYGLGAAAGTVPMLMLGEVVARDGPSAAADD
ncbi:MAG: hypothetical protein ABEJ79_03980 [Halolamina sp.]